MSDLLQAAFLYQKLQNHQYSIVLGRKKQAFHFRLSFRQEELFHLLGLQKLKDIADINQHRKYILQNILSGNLTLDYIMQSMYYQNNFKKRIIGIADRIKYFSCIEEMLDSNDLIYRFNPKVLPYSTITASFLLEYSVENVPLYLFLDRKQENTCFCKSFFPYSFRDYTYNQIKMTLLHKEKHNLQTGEKITLYSRLDETELSKMFSCS